MQSTAGGSAGACVHGCVNAHTHPHTKQMNPTFLQCEGWELYLFCDNLHEKLVHSTANILAQNQIRSLS